MSTKSLSSAEYVLDCIKKNTNENVKDVTQ